MSIQFLDTTLASCVFNNIVGPTGKMKPLKGLSGDAAQKAVAAGPRGQPIHRSVHNLCDGARTQSVILLMQHNIPALVVEFAPSVYRALSLAYMGFPSPTP